MIAIDTNVLVRILVEDTGQPAQTVAARKLARSSKQVYVPQIVQAETVWVLETAYEFDKSGIVEALEHLDGNGAFVLQHSESFSEALKMYRNGMLIFPIVLFLWKAGGSVRNYTLLTDA